MDRGPGRATLSHLDSPADSTPMLGELTFFFLESCIGTITAQEAAAVPGRALLKAFAIAILEPSISKGGRWPIYIRGRQLTLEICAAIAAQSQLEF